MEYLNGGSKESSKNGRGSSLGVNKQSLRSRKWIFDPPQNCLHPKVELRAQDLGTSACTSLLLVYSVLIGWNITRGNFGRTVPQYRSYHSLCVYASDLHHITIVPDGFPDNPTTLSCCTTPAMMSMPAPGFGPTAPMISVRQSKLPRRHARPP